MAIDFNSDIVDGFYASNVATETAYQSPGDFGIPAVFDDPDAGKRILTLVELFRAFLEAAESTREAKLVQELLAKMIAAVRFGSATWDGSAMATDAQTAALRYLAGHVISTDL